MRYSFYAVLALVVAASAHAADPKSEKDDFKDKLAKSGILEGTITQLDTTAKGLTVDVVQKIGKPNLQARENLLSLNQQLINARRNTNPVDRANQIASINTEIAKNTKNLTSYEDKHYRFEVQAADTMKVRQKSPPAIFDDKGKPKRYTQRELAALKGPERNLEGYHAEFDNLKTGQKVKVYFKKQNPSKPSSKDADKDAANSKRLSANLIVILEEAPK